MNSRIPYQTGARPHSLNGNSGKPMQPADSDIQLSINDGTSPNKDK